MNVEAIAAWLAAIVACGSAVLAWTGSRDVEKLKHQLEDQRLFNQRGLQARERFDRYREPLLIAVDEFGHRIDTIRHGGVVGLIASGGARSDVALRSTLYRIALLLGRIELLYRDVNILRLSGDTETREVGALLRRIARTLATMEPDQVLCLWRDEQRAIGQLMIVDSGTGTPRVVGFSEFVETYEAVFDRWMHGLAADMAVISRYTSIELRSHVRMLTLQTDLAELAIKLDTESLLVTSHGSKSRPGWITRVSPMGSA